MSALAILTRPIGWAILHSLWQIGAIALALKAALCLVSQQNARLRHALGCAALLLCVLVPAATIPLASRATATRTAIGPAAAIAAARPVAAGGRVSIARGAQLEPPRTRLAAMALADRLEPLLPGIVLIWLLGVSLFSLRPFCGWLTVRRWSRVHAEALPPFLQQLVRRATERMGIRRAVRVLRSSLAQSPIVIGCVRPIVLLPAAVITGLSPRELETILLHELAHVRRFDPLVNLMQTMLEAVLFYHPAMWWIARVVRAERERACDDLAVELSGDRLAYVRALATLEDARAVPAAAVAARGGSLVARVRRLVRRPQHGDDVRPASLLAILALLAMLALVFVSSQSLASTAPGGVQEQRRENEATFSREQDRLRSECRGQWVAIAGGQVHGPFPSWQAAVEASDARVRGIAHRFVFRPGRDDSDVEFVTSPWSNTPGWNQFGRQFQLDQKLTIAASLWARDGRSLAAADGRAAFRMGAPGMAAELEASAVCSGLFEHELTLTAEQARELALERFSVPGVARDRGFPVACRKAWCRVVIPGLGIDTVLTAFVIPDQVVAGAPQGEQPRSSGTRRGVKPPANDARRLAWGNAIDGLQAALELPAGNAYAILDAIAAVIVIRNVSDHTITFASSVWREDDQLLVQDATGKPVSVGRNWYSGLPTIQQWVLRPGEEARLMAGSIGLARDGSEPHAFTHPVVYVPALVAGAYTLAMRLRIPDVGHDAPQPRDWRGTLVTGAVAIDVR